MAEFLELRHPSGLPKEMAHACATLLEFLSHRKFPGRINEERQDEFIIKAIRDAAETADKAHELATQWAGDTKSKIPISCYVLSVMKAIKTVLMEDELVERIAKELDLL